MLVICICYITVEIKLTIIIIISSFIHQWLDYFSFVFTIKGFEKEEKAGAYVWVIKLVTMVCMLFMREKYRLSI